MARILFLSTLVVALLLPAGPLLAQDSELTVKDLQKLLNDQQKLLEKQGKEFGLMMLPVKDASDEHLEILAAWLRRPG